MADKVVDSFLAEVAQAMRTDLEALVGDHVRHQLAAFPAIATDQPLLTLMRSTIRDTLATELDLVAHGLDPMEVTSPPSVTTWARRVAQRGYPLSSILRAYQGEQSLLMRQFVARIDAASPSRELAISGVLRINELSAGLHQRVFLLQIAETYDAEIEKLAQTRAATRKARVLQLLAGSDADAADAEHALGYRLSGPQLGVVARLAGPDPDPATLAPSISRLASVVGTPAPLITLQDESTAWAWFPEPPAAEALVAAARSADRETGLLLATGTPRTGLAGFRLTHSEALTAFSVLEIAGADAAPNAVTFEDAGVVGILAQNLTVTRAWVTSTLGSLAENTAAGERLRDTLATFLRREQSFVATAAEMTLHRNTVKYRVDQAKHLLPAPLATHRADVELALRTARLLGRAVLVDAEHRSRRPGRGRTGRPKLASEDLS
ncbi:MULTISPECIES: PucR family transcriptional regulator [unclassified Microbacterium]|uniref:PucR family transcriptional regulator n=1 Tax=unclassified Microbacterium TaxID=2609290 RepID=UPI003015B72A